MSNLSWFADYFDILAGQVLPSEFLRQQRRNFYMMSLTIIGMILSFLENVVMRLLGDAF